MIAARAPSFVASVVTRSKSVACPRCTPSKTPIVATHAPSPDARACVPLSTSMPLASQNGDGPQQPVVRSEDADGPLGADDEDGVSRRLAGDRSAVACAL